jgi:hypothetical protein
MMISVVESGVAIISSPVEYFLPRSEAFEVTLFLQVLVEFRSVDLVFHPVAPLFGLDYLCTSIALVLTLLLVDKRKEL